MNRQYGQFKFDELSHQIIDCAVEVHRELGPGFPKKSYERCLCYELAHRGIDYQRQVPLPFVYKGMRFDCGYAVDVLVQNQVVVELKCSTECAQARQWNGDVRNDELSDVAAQQDAARLMTYLKLAHAPIGLLIDFNVCELREGLTRFSV